MFWRHAEAAPYRLPPARDRGRPEVARQPSAGLPRSQRQAALGKARTDASTWLASGHLASNPPWADKSFRRAPAAERGGDPRGSATPNAKRTSQRRTAFSEVAKTPEAAA